MRWKPIECAIDSTWLLSKWLASSPDYCLTVLEARERRWAWVGLLHEEFESGELAGVEVINYEGHYYVDVDLASTVSGNAAALRWQIEREIDSGIAQKKRPSDGL